MSRRRPIASGSVVSLAEYRKRFETDAARLLDAAKDASAEYHGGLTVAKAFALAIDEAAKLHPAAEPLIVYAALLAPEPIPLFLFSEARENSASRWRRSSRTTGWTRRWRRYAPSRSSIARRLPDERDPADSDRDDPAASTGAGGGGGAAPGRRRRK